MSQMRMYCAGAGTLWVKVISFNSSLEGTITPSQTKQALHHYPRKATHQKVNFELVTSTGSEKQAIIDFIRRHQKYALTSPQKPEVMLWWPQRGIRNWSGIIKRVEAGSNRFSVASKVSFTVDLVDSLLSEKTWWGSVADDFDSYFDNAIEPPGDWKQPLPPLPPALPNQPGHPDFIGPV